LFCNTISASYWSFVALKNAQTHECNARMFYVPDAFRIGVCVRERGSGILTVFRGEERELFVKLNDDLFVSMQDFRTQATRDARM